MVLYDLKGAAQVLGVREDTVREWVRGGRLRASRMSGSKTVRISEEDIRDFYDANETMPMKRSPQTALPPYRAVIEAKKGAKT